jgi:hypothetical protein
MTQSGDLVFDPDDGREAGPLPPRPIGTLQAAVESTTDPRLQGLYEALDTAVWQVNGEVADVLQRLAASGISVELVDYQVGSRWEGDQVVLTATARCRVHGVAGAVSVTDW